MNRLFLECNMGVAGNMLTGALYELLTDQQKIQFKSTLDNLGIEGLEVIIESVAKCGIYGTGVRVKIHGQEEESLDVHLHRHDQHAHSHCQHGHDHSHTHEHHSDEDDKHCHAHTHCHCHDHEQGHGHDHEHGHCHCHGHSHAHDHNHDNGHSHAHDHSHDHEHSHDHHHAHFTVGDVKEIVGKLPLSDKIKSDIIDVYNIIAEAESKSHQLPIELVHFHEVGQMDAIVDVTMVAILIDMLDIDFIQASPINTGFGNVKCAHGILPVPAPATAHILQTIPNYSNQIEGELATPTGVALMKHYVNEFISHRPISQSKIGYGMGTKDFEQANCVRAFLSQEASLTDLNIVELSCNIDDMTPEAIGYAMEVLMEMGALDVYITPIQMKKNRPGFLLTVTCRSQQLDQIREGIFKHTTTIGIKDYRPMRYALKREISEEMTPFGPIKVKQSRGYGIERRKYEYDDLKGIAKENQVSLEYVLEHIRNHK